jgi:hypothetical protein
MAQGTSDGPPAAIFRFFADLSEDDRAWLALCCSFWMEEPFIVIKTATDADAWLQQFLNRPNRPRVRAAHLIYLIAILDFELSPFAFSRMEARAHWMSESEKDFIADQGRKMLQDIVPRLSGMVDVWKDVRTHELDEASLWVYRDEAQRQETAETIAHFELPGMPPKKPS